MVRKPSILLIAAALITALAVAVPTASASTKVKGKVRACVIKKGDDKGLMRFAPKGKCKGGEKKLTWNKRGKQGPKGAAGPAGPGAQTDQLEATIAVLCTQLAAVTTQLNSLQTVVSGLGLSGVPLGVITIPPLPAPSPPFGCS